MGMAMPAAAQAALTGEIDTPKVMKIMACLPDNLPDALATLNYCRNLLIEFHTEEK
jgi:hypothetical protein